MPPHRVSWKLERGSKGESHGGINFDANSNFLVSGKTSIYACCCQKKKVAIDVKLSTNMWFVLATATPGEIETVADAIEESTGLAVHRFPKLEEYFVGFRVAA